MENISASCRLMQKACDQYADAIGNCRDTLIGLATAAGIITGPASSSPCSPWAPRTRRPAWRTRPWSPKQLPPPKHWRRPRRGLLGPLRLRKPRRSFPSSPHVSLSPPG
nr:hypothetical protein asmbl_30 [uncultured bacterium]